MRTGMLNLLTISLKYLKITQTNINVLIGKKTTYIFNDLFQTKLKAVRSVVPLKARCILCIGQDT